MAGKLAASRVTAHAVVRNKLGALPLKHVGTKLSAEAKREKRKRIAKEILDLREAAMQTIQTFWPGETWVDQDSRARYNPQNERARYQKSATGDGRLEELFKPARQRAPGSMVRSVVVSAGGGKLLTPHFAPRKQTATAAYYRNRLKTDTLRQIASRALEGGAFYFRQDLASSRAAKQTHEQREQEGGRVAP